jgi:hypothetical protein
MASTWAGWAVSAVTSKFYKSPNNQMSEQAPALLVSTQGSLTTRNSSTDDSTIATSDELRRSSYTESPEESVQWGNINVLLNNLNTSRFAFQLLNLYFYILGAIKQKYCG